ncbi:MAG TPA: DNA polymerase III subunit beta [Ktedonobacterales bacterium]|nr:DNA polymerase III subunit beta [Ktedonobacterales bacterium]
MKLTCNQQELAKGLSTVSHAVSNRTTLPILSHILIATEGDHLRLAATNLEIGITCRVPATIQQEGTTTVPARLFTDFVNGLSESPVTLALNPETQSLKVSGKPSQCTIRGMDAAEFPAIPSADAGEAAVELPAAELREMIAHTAFAAATDDARPVFTGVLARAHDGVLTFAAADSFRLAVRKADVPGTAALTDVLIPAKTLTELARILPADTETAVRMIVTPNRNQVVFQAGDINLVSNLIAGQFPNFEAILPKSSATRASLPTTEFRQAAKTASLFARDSANIVRLKVEAGEGGGVMPGSVTLLATAEEIGDTTTTLNAAVDGNGLEIIFNVKYLTDVLGVIDSGDVALELNTPQQPGVVKPVGALGDKYVYVIMPMHSTR